MSEGPCDLPLAALPLSRVVGEQRGSLGIGSRCADEDSIDAPDPRLRRGYEPTPVEVSDELFDKLRQHFDEAQLVELTHHIALENMRGRFNLALGIGSVGFSNGMVCAVPTVHP